MTSISKPIASDVFAAARARERSQRLDSLQDLRQHLKQQMEACRSATLALFETIDHATFCQQAHPDFSPIGWHLGHIAYTEALWLLEHSAGQSPQFPEYRRLFAADTLPKAERVYLPDFAEIQIYLQSVRAATFAYLETAPLDVQERLWRWLLQHESQHGETIALVLELGRRQKAEGRGQKAKESGQRQKVKGKRQKSVKSGQPSAVSGQQKIESDQRSAVSGQPSAINSKLSSEAALLKTQNSKLKTSPAPPASSASPAPPTSPASPASSAPLAYPYPSHLSPLTSPLLPIPAGTFDCGNESIDALDNERPVHRVYVDAYWIDRDPVTCGHYQAFMAAGGYADSRWWSVEGWEWLQTAQVTEPLYWSAAAADRANHPVCGVSWYEADAYARFVGKRLPTEAEWEKAASWHPIAKQRQTYTWGELAPSADDCNCNHWVGRTTPVDAYPAGVSAFGCYDLLGNVWEWTASWFDRYTGFEAYPYRGYSQAYFDGQHRVLKGGSWATQPSSLRCAFRNWYHPHVREILAGFRCASDHS